MKKAIDLLERFQLMTKLIVEEKTGKPEEFARRLGISRSTMYEMLEELRFHDADIRFSRSKNSFVFINEMDIHSFLYKTSDMQRKEKYFRRIPIMAYPYWGLFSYKIVVRKRGKVNIFSSVRKFRTEGL